MAAATTTHAFTLILAGTSELSEGMADALYEAGCDDATPSSRDGVVSVAFDREAGSLGDAIGSAIEAVRQAGFRVARVEVDPAEE